MTDLTKYLPADFDSQRYLKRRKKTTRKIDSIQELARQRAQLIADSDQKKLTHISSRRLQIFYSECLKGRYDIF